MNPRRHAQRDPLPGGRHREVERELGRESRQVERPALEIGCGLPRQAEDERRADGVRGVQDAEHEPLEVQPPAKTFDRAAEKDPTADRQRHRPARKQKQHRHEDQLRGNCRPTGDLELKSEGRGIRADQKQDRCGPRSPIRGEIEGKCHGGRDEGGREGQQRPELPPRQALKPPHARLLDHSLFVGVEYERIRMGGGRSRHRQMKIDPARPTRFTRSRDAGASEAPDRVMQRPPARRE